MDSNHAPTRSSQDVSAFPEYYAPYFKEAMMGVPSCPVVCMGPVKYKGEAKLQIDIANVKAAAKAVGVPDNHVFLPATAPFCVGVNEYYKSDEEYLHALAIELNKEYRAIVAAGILLQIDDPFLPNIFVEPGLDDKQMQRRAEIYVEATNAALGRIPVQRVRFHTCHGINEGPRLYEANLPQIIEYVLKINAGSFSFEAANPRHDHECHLFERVKVPDGKVLCPGVITHASNIVEHPEWIAERLIRYANLVGRENVIAGVDFRHRRSIEPRSTPRWCGRSSRRCEKAPTSQQRNYGASIAYRRERLLDAHNCGERGMLA
jgi:5-methyltetrahydropteroyltriglutamate--homocysteine methyltransferase